MNLPLILLAAGTSSRTHGAHKLLARRHGVALARVVALAALDGGARPVIVVTGAAPVEPVLADLPVLLVRHAGFAAGMGASLAAGLAAAMPRDPDGVVVMLADMPAVTGAHVRAVRAAFAAAGGDVVVRACAAGVPGHPVVLPRRLLARAARLRDDVGARALLSEEGVASVTVEIGPAARLDLDTPEALRAAGFR